MGSLPKAMSISRSEIFRKKKKKKRPENEKSWKVMGVQWEVIGGQRKVSGRSWEVSGRSRGGHWRSLGGCSLPKEMGISRSEIFRKKKKKKKKDQKMKSHGRSWEFNGRS